MSNRESVSLQDPFQNILETLREPRENLAIEIAAAQDDPRECAWHLAYQIAISKLLLPSLSGSRFIPVHVHPQWSLVITFDPASEDLSSDNPYEYTVRKDARIRTVSPAPFTPGTNSRAMFSALSTPIYASGSSRGASVSTLSQYPRGIQVLCQQKAAIKHIPVTPATSSHVTDQDTGCTVLSEDPLLLDRNGVPNQYSHFDHKLPVIPRPESPSPNPPLDADTVMALDLFSEGSMNQEVKRKGSEGSLEGLPPSKRIGLGDNDHTEGLTKRSTRVPDLTALIYDLNDRCDMLSPEILHRRIILLVELKGSIEPKDLLSKLEITIMQVEMQAQHAFSSEHRPRSVLGSVIGIGKMWTYREWREEDIKIPPTLEELKDPTWEETPAIHNGLPEWLVEIFGGEDMIALDSERTIHAFQKIRQSLIRHNSDVCSIPA